MSNTNEYLMSEARKELASRAGKACRDKHGRAFYKRISKKGVEARKKKRITLEQDLKEIAELEHKLSHDNEWNSQ